MEKEVINILFEGLNGTATRLAGGTMGCHWQIDVNGQQMMTISESYHGVPHYMLFSHSDVISKEKATEQTKVIIHQIHKVIMDRRPRPPKRYK